MQNSSDRSYEKCAKTRATRIFSEAIRERTGIYVDYNSLDRCERGERVPGLDRFFAIVATLEFPMTAESFGGMAVDFFQESIDGPIALELIELELSDLKREPENIASVVGLWGKPSSLQLLKATRFNLSRVRSSLDELTLADTSEEEKRSSMRREIAEIETELRDLRRSIELMQDDPTKPAEWQLE